MRAGTEEYSQGTPRVPREYSPDGGRRGFLTGYSQGTPREPREYSRYGGRRYLNFAQIAGVLGDLKLNWPSEISTVLSFLGLLDFGACDPRGTRSGIPAYC